MLYVCLYSHVAFSTGSSDSIVSTVQHICIVCLPRENPRNTSSSFTEGRVQSFFYTIILVTEGRVQSFFYTIILVVINNRLIF